MRFAAILGMAGALALSGCVKVENEADTDAAGTGVVEAPEGLAPGSNEMLRAKLSAAPDLEVLVSDVIIPPGAEVPRHYHPGEEFVYVIEGSAIHVQEGQPDRELGAGDAMVIEPEAVHSPRGGANGTRAIVFRVHLKDQPERIAVPAETAAGN
ncbi:cupin domain-containing protein [Qipengyuania sphaerica]|uniref:cupin domain-containing protein n=1 Tax=Qipengyuania sphaerica TaxID=2867243 RepID=UPI001C885E72|nr:cupin domain-containing protein [Qipengyuania sphaerica]MBX7541407.1 cupin domain-containing protein [Qipengyuania sphaerica]